MRMLMKFHHDQPIFNKNDKMAWNSWDDYVQSCGCVTSSRSNDLNQEEQDVSYCEKHTARIAMYAVEASKARAYNIAVRRRFSKLNTYALSLLRQRTTELEKRLSQEEMLVPVKYLYEAMEYNH